MTGREPTPEQQAVIDTFRAGRNVVVEAGAGCGKTTTMKQVSAHMARAGRQRSGVYLAYNRAIADDAKGGFPAHVQCATAHSFAYRAVAGPYRHRLNGPRVPARQAADIMRLHGPTRIGDVNLAPQQVARLVMETVDRFCRSADPVPDVQHVPVKAGLDSEAQKRELRAAIAPLARKAWADLSRPDGKLRFTHDCQPPGTLVRRVIRRGGHFGSSFEDVPIERITEGDYVVSYDMRGRRGYVRRDGRPVTAVGTREYSGDLITVTTDRGRSSSYTREHRCVVRLDCGLPEGNHVVYLAKRGSDFRIGRTTWRTRSQGNTLGILRRAASQDADAIWVLSVHATDADAALAEALAAHQWRIPTWQFRSSNETMPLEKFWAKAGGNADDARMCLDAHGRDLLHPFWQREDGWWGSTRRPVVLRAANLLPGMLVLEPDEIKPASRGDLRANEGSGGWSPITVTRTRYEGPVYNLDVAEDHTYIADGIATHNCYLKMWQLTGPRIPADVIMLDEAQDANPVILDVVLRQDHAQLVAVGDRCQAIYQWRGAIDAMDRFPEAVTLPLSQSFRFGPAVAREANKWLTILESPLRLAGWQRISSRVGEVSNPDAILCRTNAEAMAQAMALLRAGRPTAIVGGGKDIKALAEAAASLKAGRGCTHPELFAFANWGEVQDYAENDPAGSDLAVLVRLIDEHSPEVIIDMCDRLADERHAHTVISTAHKAKGREWNSVRIAGDFKAPRARPDEPDEQPPIPADQAMLAYVAVTRAQLSLDPHGLSWVNDYLPEGVAA